MNKWDFRRPCARDAAAIAALPFAVGLPFLWVQHLLFRPSGRVFSLMTTCSLSPDVLTAIVMAAYCLLFGLALFAGDRFLRQFLSRQQAT